MLAVAVIFAAAFATAKQSPSATDLPKVIYADPHALADAKAKFLAGTNSLNLLSTSCSPPRRKR